MKSASGSFVLRISPALHQRLRDVARKQGQSLNRFCAETLERAVSPSIELGSERPGDSGTLLRSLAGACVSEFGEDLLGVVLFGSVARGEARPDSDLDLLLVLARRRPIRRSLYATWEQHLACLAALSLAHEVNPHFSHLPEAPDVAGGLWLEAAVDGRVLWERAGRVSVVLRALRGHLAEGGAVRRVQHGHPYWVRPNLVGRNGE